ncbi:MAG: hypothetical protein CMJ78_27455 [Planctomycetaceae bacterium]|nr:hypothetical protein [Planctomycetaceae bacterium]
MEASIKSQFSSELLADAISRFGITASTVKELDGFESFVYECELAGQLRILRISHSRHRSVDQIAAEIEWIQFLADHGLNVCFGVPSISGNFVERLGDDADHFIAAVFLKAPGCPPTAEFQTPELFESMGRMMGQMHWLAKQYQPASTNCRHDWFTDVDGLARTYIPSDQPLIIEKFEAIIEETQSLSKDVDSYGLIHFDFHSRNFLVDDVTIHLFDFDDGLYSWFADDIAMALFYAVSHDCRGTEELARANGFLRHFLTGYRSKNELDGEWLQQIPLFLKRRELTLYAVIHRSIDLDNSDTWTKSFVDRRPWKIESDVPYIDLDFTNF